MIPYFVPKYLGWGGLGIRTLKRNNFIGSLIELCAAR